MRKRIWALADDEFDTQAPELLVKPDRIEIEAAEASKISGSFTVASKNGVPLRGIVYSSNPYVVCRTAQFEGLENTISYEVRLPGARAGDCLRGQMTIVVNRACLKVPYEISYQRAGFRSSIGEIREIRQFALLARDHWQEALSLFFSDAFARWIKGQDQKIELLYRAYRRGILSGVNLEHFLVDARLKEPLIFGLPDETRKYSYLREDQEDRIQLLKKGWGYGEIRLRSEGDFIRLNRKKISSDEFLGQAADIPYLLRADRLRAGVNFGSIQIETNGLVHRVLIQACRDSFPSSIPGIRQNERTLIVRVMRDYESYRLGRMSRPEWCHRWLRDLEDLRCLAQDREVFWQLLETMALMKNGQTEEALDLIGRLKEEISDKNSPDWGLLLYLYATLSSDEANRRELIRQINIIFRRHRDRADLFSCLVHAGREDRALKFASICEESEHFHSPLLYLEAYDLLREEPYLLTEADDFALRFFAWVRSRRAFSSALVDRLVKILATAKSYKPAWARIFMEAVDAYPAKENLSALVAYLLLGRQESPGALIRYERAIREEINVTGLYEAYLKALPQDSVHPIPPLAARYFLLKNRLPIEKQALLYANIISFKDTCPKIYEAYENQLNRFAEQMMIEGRIDDNIAIVYSDYLDRIRPSETVARAMAPLLFTHKILCTAEGARRILVYHRAMADPVMASVSGQAAYLPLYGGDQLLVLEDEKGAITAGETLFGAEPLLDIDRLYERLAPLAPDSLPYILHGLFLYPGMSPDRRQLLVLISSYKVREDFWFPYYEKLREGAGSADLRGAAEDYFCRLSDLSEADLALREEITAAWIRGGQYHRARLALRNYLMCGLETEDLATLLLAMSREENSDDSRDFGLSFCGFLLDRVREGESAESWEEELLAYMLRGFVGSTDRMMALWQIASEAKMDRFPLAERILVQSLYAEDIQPDLPKVYDDYRRQRSNSKITEAYLNFFANRYLLNTDAKKACVPDHVFFYIYDIYTKRRTPSRSCMLALLKRLSDSDQLSNPEFSLLDRLIGQALGQRIRFSFMLEVDHSLLMKYQLYDKTLIEHRSKPRQAVHIRYAVSDGSYREELMREVYPGIYSKQLVLFAGQTVDYLIWDDPEGEERAIRGRIVREVKTQLDEQAAYARLNRIEGLLAADDLGGGIAKMMDYRMQENIASRLFPLV